MTGRGDQSEPLSGLGLVFVVLAVAIVTLAVRVSWNAGFGSAGALPELRVDVNSAAEAQLVLLPGIGPRLAERIVHDREHNGAYGELSELQRVRWIGPVVVERISTLAFAGDDDA